MSLYPNLKLKFKNSRWRMKNGAHIRCVKACFYACIEINRVIRKPKSLYGIFDDAGFKRSKSQNVTNVIYHLSLTTMIS